MSKKKIIIALWVIELFYLTLQFWLDFEIQLITYFFIIATFLLLVIVTMEFFYRKSG